jgi:dipeptidyl aminopeptidase/acylaminoacyl peptidase
VVRVLAALLALGLAACEGSDDQPKAFPTAAPPQDAARIIAIRTRPGNPPRFALVTLGDDGSRLHALVKAPAAAIERLDAPAWSPDAKHVYFVGVLGEREGDDHVYYDSDIFAIGAQGGRRRRITNTGDARAAVPSPDGKTLLLGRGEHQGKRPFTNGLWLADPDGGKIRRLLGAEDGRLDLAGSWSPDGRTIAFTRCTFEAPDKRGLIHNTCAVYTVSPDGSDLQKLADRSSQPAFSPDGRFIAFVSDRDDNGELAAGEDEDVFANELYVMDADGGNQRRLTETEGLDEALPTWSPDGSRIAYEREGPARFTEQLMIVNADGTCQTLLIGNADELRFFSPSFTAPAWRPGPLTGELAPLDCD